MPARGLTAELVRNSEQGLGTYVGSAPGPHRRWRLQRYAEIWVLLQSSMVLRGGAGSDNDDTLHVAAACRQGKHRSVSWMLLESSIMEACGFKTSYQNSCWWAQAKSRCQSRSWPGRCENCGSVMRSDYVMPFPEVQEAVVDEFFHTVLLLETLAE